jgi:HEAT repeat protein
VSEGARRLAIDALAEALGMSDAYVKLGVLDSLNRLEASLPWRVCEPLTRDPVLKRHAMALLARSDEPEALASLARSVGDPSAAVAREAVVALGDAIAQNIDDDALMEVARTTLRPSEAAQARVRSFAQRDDDPKARGAALATLGLVKDPDDVPLLVDALGDDEVAERAELGLQLFGESAVGPMLDAARTAPPPARSASISMAPMLSAHGDEDVDVVAALRSALDDASPDVVSAALSSLGRAGDAADMPAIGRLVRHADARVSMAASDALVELAERFAPAARVLLARLQPANADAVVGCLLLRAVGERQAPADLSYLRTALAHGDARVRKEAALALGALGGDAATDAVSFALIDEEREVVIAAARAIARMGLDGDDLVGRLAGLLDHSAWEVRRVAVDLVGRTATAVAFALLLDRAKAEQEPVVRAAIAAFVGEAE